MKIINTPKNINVSLDTLYSALNRIKSELKEEAKYYSLLIWQAPLPVTDLEYTYEKLFAGRIVLLQINTNYIKSHPFP